MTEAERIALGQTRRLIFENVAKDVPVEDIMAAFQTSREDVDRHVMFVAKKIKEYRFRRKEPPIPCDTMKDIRWNRVALLETVRKLGPNYLSSELLIPKVNVQTIDRADGVREAAHRGGVRVTG